MSTKKKSSMNARLDFARENNQYAHSALLQTSHAKGAVKKVIPKEPAPLRTVSSKPEDKAQNYGVPEIQIYNCICNRKAQVVECRKCNMLFYGRVSEACRLHPNVTYLLDFFYCPSCTCSREFLKPKNVPF